MRGEKWEVKVCCDSTGVSTRRAVLDGVIKLDGCGPDLKRAVDCLNACEGIKDPEAVICMAKEAMRLSATIPHLETEMNHALCILQEKSRRTVDEVSAAREIRKENAEKIWSIRTSVALALAALEGK